MDTSENQSNPQANAQTTSQSGTQDNAEKTSVTDNKLKVAAETSNESIETTEQSGQNTSTLQQPSYIEQQTFALLQNVVADRKSERRWRFIRRLLTLLFFGVVIYSCASTGEDKIQQIHFGSNLMFNESNLDSDHIAVVPLVGIIAESEVNAASISRQLQRAFSNDAAKAVLVYANSPGGSPVQSDLINQSLVRLKKQHEKPVYAVVADVCASGCYYALAHVDKFIVNASSIIGSIGVRLESFDLRELMQKIGVKQRLLTAGDNKVMLNPFDAFPKKDRDYLQNLINQTHEEFINVVESGRSNKLGENKTELYSGLIWSGRESITLGLADELGDLHTVATELGDLELQYYTNERNFIEEILNTLSLLKQPTTQLKTQW